MAEAMSKRTTITLPDVVFEELEEWADQQGRPTANLASFLVELGIRQAKEKGEFTPQSKSKSQ
jgi:predicted DNA-binding protein